LSLNWLEQWLFYEYAAHGESTVFWQKYAKMTVGDLFSIVWQHGKIFSN